MFVLDVVVLVKWLLSLVLEEVVVVVMEEVVVEEEWCIELWVLFVI